MKMTSNEFIAQLLGFRGWLPLAVITCQRELPCLPTGLSPEAGRLSGSTPCPPTSPHAHDVGVHPCVPDFFLVTSPGNSFLLDCPPKDALANCPLEKGRRERNSKTRI